ncbi:MAG: hypothetical protein HOO67_06330 [Candidatus Peribacteraceae bacterium]|nr:hypothetical protein [Candidatus Peribacteraceae bacterium]
MQGIDRCRVCGLPTVHDPIDETSNCTGGHLLTPNKQEHAGAKLAEEETQTEKGRKDA